MISRLRGSEFARHGALVFAGVMFSNFINYVFFVLLARRVDVESYGIVTSLASAVLVVGAPAAVAQLIGARLAADLEARGDRAALRRLGDLVGIGAFVTAIVVIAVGVLFRHPLTAYFQMTDARPLLLALLALGAYALVAVQRGVLQGAHRFDDYSISLSVESLTKVVVGIWLAGPLGATGALIGVAVGSLAGVAYDVYAFRKRFGAARGQLRLDRALIALVVSNVGLGQLTLSVLAYYDVALVKHFFDPRSAGLYAAAAFVGRVILAVVTIVPTLIMPKVSAQVAAGRSPLPLLRSALGIGAVLVAGALIVTAAAPRFVVVVLAGRAFADAVPLVFPYAIAGSCLSMAYVVSGYKMGLHRYDFVIPSFVLAVAEIAAVSIWHPTLSAVVTVLAVGHLAVFGSMLYRLWSAPAGGAAA